MTAGPNDRCTRSTGGRLDLVERHLCPARSLVSAVYSYLKTTTQQCLEFFEDMSVRILYSHEHTRVAKGAYSTHLRSSISFSSHSDLPLASPLPATSAAVFRSRGQVQSGTDKRNEKLAVPYRLPRGSSNSTKGSFLILRRYGWPRYKQNKRESTKHEAEQHHSRPGGMILTEPCERQSGFRDSLLKVVTSELVVHQRTQSDRVSYVLQRRHWIMEDEHRCHNEQDIFQDARECQDNCGCLANLETF